MISPAVDGIQMRAWDMPWRTKFARYDLAGLVAGQRVDYTVAANWKIIQENFQECYHCATIHPELVDTLPQFRNLTGSRR